MKTANLLLAGLFLLSALGTGTASVSADGPGNDKAPYYWTADELDRSLGVTPNAARSDNYVRVLYFHRVPGCATCQTMAKYVYETVLKTYPLEAKDQKIILRYYNFEDPKNAKLVKTFNILSPSLVLIQGRGGKDVKAKKADKIWPLAGDKTAFMKYVGEEIGGYLPMSEKEVER